LALLSFAGITRSAGHPSGNEVTAMDINGREKPPHS